MATGALGMDRGLDAPRELVALGGLWPHGHVLLATVVAVVALYAG